MNERVFKQGIKLSMHSSERLYLDLKTSDVKFVFIVDNRPTDSVPAHKNLLSAGSPVFEAMFYGPMAEEGDVKIVDASAQAFREFLQFFYLTEPQLTLENIWIVANLCKKYDVVDGLKFCEYPLLTSLTIDQMCSGYSAANLLELKSVIAFCEQEIKQNSFKVLTSVDFLQCNRNILDHILPLVSSNCDAIVIVNAYIAWAETKCKHQKLRTTAVNLKYELGEVFDRLPFDKLTQKEFAQLIANYNGIFSKNQLIAITLAVMAKKEKIEQEQKQLVLENQRLLDKYNDKCLGSSDNDIGDESFDIDSDISTDDYVED